MSYFAKFPLGACTVITKQDIENLLLNFATLPGLLAPPAKVIIPSLTLRRDAKYSWRSVSGVLTATLFSHSNSAHICLNSASVQVAGTM